MLPRELHRLAEARNERMRERAETLFYNTLNAVGAAYHGKEWRWITPDTNATDEFEARLERARARREASRRKRRKG
jgi:hypothetical protein